MLLGIEKQEVRVKKQLRGAHAALERA